MSTRLSEETTHRLEQYGSIETGSILFVCSIWYVCVSQSGKFLNCICDNANNRYSFEILECDYIFTAYEAMRAHAWSDGSDELFELMEKRPIPVDVIAEVLAGCHDDRFSDWRKETTRV